MVLKLVEVSLGDHLQRLSPAEQARRVDDITLIGTAVDTAVMRSSDA